MKKIPIIAALAIAALMLVEPIGAASTSNDFNYTVNPIAIQLSPDTILPQGLPLCRSASLGNIVCYSPKFIKKAYGFPSTATLDGSGQTMVIVDAFGSPTIAADLARFDTMFGIPPPPSFTIFCGNSPTPLDPSTCPTVNIFNSNPHGSFGWTIETSLDVEYAHAMAPGANIVLVVAATNSGNAINAAEGAAIAAYPGAIFSQSFGIPEIFIHDNNGQINQAQANYLAAQAAHITVLASAGDLGATNGFGTPNASFPSSDPLVTAVGGTQGNPYVFSLTATPPLSCAAGATCSTGLVTFTGPCSS